MPLDWQLNTTVVALQGFPVSGTPPADGQVLTWDNAATNWAPANTQIPPTVLNYNGVVADASGLPASGAVGDMYFVTGSDQYVFWNGTSWVPLAPPLSVVSFPEAPTDGQVYGRDGALADWTAVLPLSGGTMTGGLVLDGPPTVGGDPDQAATMGYVDDAITDLDNKLQGDIVDAMQSASQWLGTFDATSGFVVYNPQTGLTNGPLVNASQVPGAFVICTIPGTLPSGPNAGQAFLAGDWLYSDGANWIPINITGTGSGGGGGPVNAVDVVVTPTVGTWTNVQQALTAINANYATLANPVFTGNPTAPNPPAGDDSQSVATTSWVNAEIAAYVAQWAIDNNVLTDVTTSGDVTSV